MADDFQLLRDYAERGKEEAFRELVERHARLVFCTARRVLGDDALAEEATQATFTLLARKAARLSSGTVVAGWLYRTARLVALEARRRELRRQQHQQNFMELNTPPESVWEKISPLVDEAMASLGANDRNAVVLRFFEGKSFAEVGAALGTTEAGAKMRVGRALEKLRRLFAREGIAVSSAVLGSAIAAHAIGAFPARLAASASSAALATPATVNTSITSLVKGALLVMAWNKVRNTAVAAVILLLLGSATIVGFKQMQRGKQSLPTVATFEPMAGEWEGTFVMKGHGMPEPLKQNTALSIRTTQQGRACDIEMRILTPAGGVSRVYRFTHALNETGTGIVTRDDPTVARLAGEGTVTLGAHDKRTGEWRAAFRAVLPDGRGTTDCEWIRRGDELTIVRHDRDGSAEEGISELHLRKAASNRPVL